MPNLHVLATQAGLGFGQSLVWWEGVALIYMALSNLASISETWHHVVALLKLDLHDQTKTSVLYVPLPYVVSVFELQEVVTLITGFNSMTNLYKIKIKIHHYPHVYVCVLPPVHSCV